MKKIILFLALVASLFTNAQQDVSVTLQDIETNQVVSGIKILLVNQGQNSKFEQTTNSQGKAIFKNLQSINDYQLVFEGNDNYLGQNSEMISLRSNQSNSVILSLKKIASTTVLNEVVISSKNATSKINRKDAEVSFELKAAEIQEIPVEGRDITRVLYRLPNVTQATGFYSEAPNVSINGANGLFTSYLIDGMDNNERFLGGQRFAIPTGFAKDVTVLTSNFSAEYGLTGSGIIDVTTKSGTNKTKGELFFTTRPGPSIDGNSQFAQRDLSGNQVKDGFARYQTGTGIGGALVKDKTFYYFNFESTVDVKDNLLKSADLAINETVRGVNNFNYFSAKIDQNWSSSFRTSLRANVGAVGIERQGGGLEGGATFPSGGNTQDRNSINLALKNSYNFGKISGETNVLYGRFLWDYANPINQNSPQVVVRNPNNEVIALLGHPGYLFKELENTIQIQQKFKFYLKNNTVKFGGNLISGNHKLFGGGNPNGNYTVDLTQAQINSIRNSNVGSSFDINDIPANATVSNYNVELRPASFGRTQNISSIYAEDLWAITNKLNVTIGIRYDYDNLSKGASDKGDTDNIAPRLNFNYQLNNKSTVRGGFGIAYDKINYAVYSDALQQNTNSADYKTQIQELVRLGILPSSTNVNAVTFAGNISANVSNVTYLNGPSEESLQAQREGVFSNERRILNPNGYKNPYQRQFAIGYQYQIDNDKLFFVDVVHNRGEDLFRLRNLNAAAEYVIDPNNVIIRTQAQADATRPIPITNSTATINGQVITGVSRNVIITESEGKSRYNALSLNYQKLRGADNFSYRLNYTLSSLKNDTEDINFRAQDANNYATEYGPSINDRTHNINAIYNYYPFKNTTITTAVLLQSGQPINRIPLGFGTTDLNGDGSGFGDAYQGNSDRFPGEARNSDRLPWSTNFDLGIQHQFTLTSSSKLEFRADIFNVFNVENLSGYSNNATQSNQIQAGSSSSGLFTQRNAGPPRQFQFGVRYLF